MGNLRTLELSQWNPCSARRGGCLRLALCLTALLLPPFAVASEPSASLEQGYRLMYSLQFDSARLEFSKWENEHAGNALGPVSEAANLLFSEFERLGVLEAQFYVKDSTFEARKKLQPDPDLRARFNATLDRAEAEARQGLAKNERDPDSQFALALVYGLKADYAALVEKQKVASLRFTRQAAEYADNLLKIAPEYYDAYLATGIGKYIVGSAVAPVRWFLEIAGYNADKARGIQELKLTAEKGRFLGPFARILLAIAYLRDNNPGEARRLLAVLQSDFPSNPLFAREIARIDGQANGSAR